MLARWPQLSGLPALCSPPLGGPVCFHRAAGSPAISHKWIHRMFSNLKSQSFLVQVLGKSWSQLWLKKRTQNKKLVHPSVSTSKKYSHEEDYPKKWRVALFQDSSLELSLPRSEPLPLLKSHFKTFLFALAYDWLRPHSSFFPLSPWPHPSTLPSPSTVRTLPCLFPPSMSVPGLLPQVKPGRSGILAGLHGSPSPGPDTFVSWGPPPPGACPSPWFSKEHLW